MKDPWLYTGRCYKKNSVCDCMTDNGLCGTPGSAKKYATFEN